MAGHMIDKGGIKNVFEAQMENPMFPVPLEAMQAELTFSDFRAGDDLDIGNSPNINVSKSFVMDNALNFLTNLSTHVGDDQSYILKI
jgi:phosphoribosyl 1,2-cyclic phosphodiesterase